MSKPFTSAFDSAFLSKLIKISAHFFGHLPWPFVEPSCLAWAVLPTPPQNLRKTTHRSIFMTEFKKPVIEELKKEVTVVR